MGSFQPKLSTAIRPAVEVRIDARIVAPTMKAHAQTPCAAAKRAVVSLKMSGHKNRFHNGSGPQKPCGPDNLRHQCRHVGGRISASRFIDCTRFHQLPIALVVSQNGETRFCLQSRQRAGTLIRSPVQPLESVLFISRVRG